MCKKLALEGFNICIVSRSQKKIEEKLEEVRSECRSGDSSFKTLCVVADFSKLFTIEEYKATIGDKVAHLDIGILALNAGWAVMGPFTELQDWEI